MRKGWEYKKLNEVCEKGASNIVINKLTDNSGEYPLFGASGLVKNIDFFHQDKPYIGIVKDGAGVGRVNIYPAYSSLVGTMQYIFPKEGYSIDFIKYFLVKLDLSHCVSGATIPHIYFKDYGKENIPTPSLATQLAIVSELDKINELIRLKKEQLKDFDNLAQSLFYEMFGDPVENEMGWNKMKWKDVLTIINGKNQSAVVDENGDYPIYGSGGIMGYANNWLCPEKCTIIGRKGNINKPIFVESKFWNVDTAFGLKPNIEILSPRFLFYFCLNYNFERHNKAVTIPSLTKADLLKIDIPLPPLPLQRLFAQRIEQIEREKSEVQKSIQDLETLLASRMQYWFE